MIDEEIKKRVNAEAILQGNKVYKAMLKMGYKMSNNEKEFFTQGFKYGMTFMIEGFTEV